MKTLTNSILIIMMAFTFSLKLDSSGEVSFVNSAQAKCCKKLKNFVKKAAPFVVGGVVGGLIYNGIKNKNGSSPSPANMEFNCETAPVFLEKNANLETNPMFAAAFNKAKATKATCDRTKGSANLISSIKFMPCGKVESLLGDTANKNADLKSRVIAAKSASGFSGVGAKVAGAVAQGELQYSAAEQKALLARHTQCQKENYKANKFNFNNEITDVNGSKKPMLYRKKSMGGRGKFVNRTRRVQAKKRNTMALTAGSKEFKMRAGQGQKFTNRANSGPRVELERSRGMVIRRGGATTSAGSGRVLGRTNGTTTRAPASNRYEEQEEEVEEEEFYEEEE